MLGFMAWSVPMRFQLVLRPGGRCRRDRSVGRDDRVLGDVKGDLGTSREPPK